VEATTDTSKKRSATSGGARSERNWSDVAIDVGLAALGIAGSAFVSGLAAAAGASTYRTLTMSRTEPATSEAATVIAMRKNA